MPKVTGPLFSVEADGALGKVLTYQRRPGGASVYGYKKPKIPLTDRQQWQRDLIKWCVYEWQQLSVGEKAEWEAKASGQGQSGYSYFIHQRRGYLFDPDVALYLPLYDSRLQGSPFLSMESHGHPCTVAGATWGIQGRSFDRIDDNISIPDHTALRRNRYDPFTLMAWIYADFLSGVIIAKAHNPATPAYYGHQLVLGTYLFLKLTCSLGRKIEVRSTTPLTTGVWYFVVGTYDGSVATQGANSMKVYINGVEDTPVVVSSRTDLANFTNTLTMRLGRNENGGYFGGTIGEAWQNNRVLTPLEIQHIYLATKWRY